MEAWRDTDPAPDKECRKRSKAHASNGREHLLARFREVEAKALNRTRTDAQLDSQLGEVLKMVCKLRFVKCTNHLKAVEGRQNGDQVGSAIANARNNPINNPIQSDKRKR